MLLEHFLSQKTAVVISMRYFQGCALFHTGPSMVYWLKFFTDAGIPPDEAANYSVIFTDHRIQSSMLTDLNKEYLTEMGIKCMGDVIAILKQAKNVHSPVSTHIECVLCA